MTALEIPTVEQISKERYEAAGETWAAARERMDAALDEIGKAETALYNAEEALAAQEAAPGIPAYWHATVSKERCRIGPNCRVHNPGGGW